MPANPQLKLIAKSPQGNLEGILDKNIRWSSPTQLTLSNNMLCKTSITLYKDRLIYQAIAHPTTQIEYRKSRNVIVRVLSFDDDPIRIHAPNLYQSS